MMFWVDQLRNKGRKQKALNKCILRDELDDDIFLTVPLELKLLGHPLQYIADFSTTKQESPYI